MTEVKLPSDGDPRPAAARRGTLGDSIVLRDGATLLTYEILPAPNPLQANGRATLTLVVSNGRGAMVACTSITLTLAVGTNAKDLVASAEGITSQVPAGWSAAQSAGAFTLAPQTPDAGKIGPAGLSFVFAGLVVNGQVGTTAVTIDEVAGMGGQTPQERSGAIALPKFPTQFMLSDLTAEPLEVSAGDAATLNWSGSPASYRLEFNPGAGSQTVPVGNMGPYVAGDLTRYPEVVFTLVVAYAVPGQDQPVVAQKQASVQVDPALPEVTSFSGSAAGGGATLHWASRNADACSMNALPQLLKPSGSAGPLPVDRIRYSLTASSSRTGTSSAPSFADLHMTVTRRQPLVDFGPLYAQWLAKAGDASTLVAILYTGAPTTTYINTVDRATLGITGGLSYYFVGPAMAASSDGARVFANTKQHDNTAWLILATIATLDVLEVPCAFDSPMSAAFSPDGATIYLTTITPFGVHVLDAALVEQRFFAVPDLGPCVVSDDGSRLYIAGGELFVIFDIATGAILGQPAIGSSRSGEVVVDSVRNRAFVTRTDLGIVTVVDVDAMTVLGEVTVGAQPASIAMGPGGDEVYVASSPAQSITVIDADALKVITTVAVPPSDYPVGLAFAPGAPLELYALTSTDKQVPAICVLQVTS